MDSVPSGSRGRGLARPHAAKAAVRRRAHRIGLSHSVTQQARALASASSWGSPPSNSARVAPLVEEGPPVLARPTVPTLSQQCDNLGLVASKQVEDHGRPSSARSSPSRRSSTPAALAAFRASAALTASPSSLLFPAQIGAGDLRPHRPHRSPRWISTGWRGRLNWFLALYRPRRPRPSAEARPRTGCRH